MQLKQLDSYPQALLTCQPDELENFIPEPTLFHLQGRNTQPLFISGMLHGNEPTGFFALQKILQKYQNKTLPRSFSFFLGNVKAAQFGLRRLDQQPDYNRIWPGTLHADCNETRFAQQVVTTMQQRQVFASIDIHNNTGINPHYACINKLDRHFIQLASLFGRLIVYFTRPAGVQSAAFAHLCPAVTLECGRPDQKFGVQHAYEFLDSCLHLSDFSDQEIPPQDYDLFHSVAQVRIPDSINFSFDDAARDLQLDTALDRMNFTEVPAGTSIAQVKNSQNLPILALDENYLDVTEKYFEIKRQRLFIKRKTMPSMLTLDKRVIRQDCLCYLMERIKL